MTILFMACVNSAGEQTLHHAPVRLAVDSWLHFATTIGLVPGRFIANGR